MTRTAKGKSTNNPAAGVKPLVAGKGAQVYSKRTQLRIKLSWIVVAERIKHAETYAELYESLYGEVYPVKAIVKQGGGCFGGGGAAAAAEGGEVEAPAPDAAHRMPDDRAVSVRLHTGKNN